MILFILGILIFIGALVYKHAVMMNVKDKEKRVKYIEEHTSNDGYGLARDREAYSLSRAQEALQNARLNLKYTKITTIAGAVVLVIFIALSMIAIVPTGHTGVKVTFGKVEDNVLPSGLNFILPWQSVVNMDNREQKVPFTLESFSKDIQQVDVQGSINVNIDKPTAMDLYKDVGKDYMTILVQPRVLEDVKIVIARYTAENLIENRQKAADAIFDLLKSELAVKGINVISFAIENIDFTDTFESAVEAKQVATQEKLKAQTEQERQTMEQQQQAERERIKAQAAADVLKIDADAQAYSVKVQAEAQAEANKEIAATLSNDLIHYNLVKQWNGKLPVVSSDGSNIIDLRSLTEEPTE